MAATRRYLKLLDFIEVYANDLKDEKVREQLRERVDEQLTISQINHRVEELIAKPIKNWLTHPPREFPETKYIVEAIQKNIHDSSKKTNEEIKNHLTKLQKALEHFLTYAATPKEQQSIQPVLNQINEAIRHYSILITKEKAHRPVEPSELKKQVEESEQKKSMPQSTRFITVATILDAIVTDPHNQDHIKLFIKILRLDEPTLHSMTNHLPLERLKKWKTAINKEIQPRIGTSFGMEEVHRQNIEKFSVAIENIINKRSAPTEAKRERIIATPVIRILESLRLSASLYDREDFIKQIIQKGVIEVDSFMRDLEGYKKHYILSSHEMAERIHEWQAIFNSSLLQSKLDDKELPLINALATNLDKIAQKHKTLPDNNFSDIIALLNKLSKIPEIKAHELLNPIKRLQKSEEFSLQLYHALVFYQENHKPHRLSNQELKEKIDVWKLTLKKVGNDNTIKEFEQQLDNTMKYSEAVTDRMIACGEYKQGLEKEMKQLLGKKIKLPHEKDKNYMEIVASQVKKYDFKKDMSSPADICAFLDSNPNAKPKIQNLLSKYQIADQLFIISRTSKSPTSDPLKEGNEFLLENEKTILEYPDNLLVKFLRKLGAVGKVILQRHFKGYEFINKAITAARLFSNTSAIPEEPKRASKTAPNRSKGKL